MYFGFNFSRNFKLIQFFCHTAETRSNAIFTFTIAIDLKTLNFPSVTD